MAHFPADERIGQHHANEEADHSRKDADERQRRGPAGQLRRRERQQAAERHGVFVVRGPQSRHRLVPGPRLREDLEIVLGKNRETQRPGIKQQRGQESGGQNSRSSAVKGIRRRDGHGKTGARRSDSRGRCRLSSASAGGPATPTVWRPERNKEYRRQEQQTVVRKNPHFRTPDACNSAQGPVEHFLKSFIVRSDDGQRFGRWRKEPSRRWRSFYNSTVWSSERYETMLDFWGGYGIFVVGAIAIVVLVGILIFMRLRKTDD